MRLGIGSYACPWAVQEGGLDAIGIIRRAHELNVRVVQLADNIPLQTATQTKIEAFRRAANEAEVELELGTRGLAREHLCRFLELCGDLNAKLLRVIVDTEAHQPEEQEIVRMVRDIAADLEQARVTLAIENHDRFPAQTLAGIVQRIDSPMAGVCLDTVNSFGALEGPAHVIEVLAPYVVNLHLKDFIIAREPHMMGFRIAGAPAGRGMLDIPWLLERLRMHGARGNAILELWPPPESNRELTIAKEARWCEDSVRYLRRFILD